MGRTWSMPLLCVLAVLGLGACDSTPEPPPGTVSTQSGWARVAYPEGWSVVPESAVPSGWDWAAQPASGADASAQIAVDGDFSRHRDLEISASSLLAGAQIGGLPGFSLLGSEPVDVHGATEAKRFRFIYRPEGAEYEGVWWVAKAEDDRTIAVQLTGRKPLSDSLADQTLAGLGISAKHPDEGSRA